VTIFVGTVGGGFLSEERYKSEPCRLAATMTGRM